MDFTTSLYLAAAGMRAQSGRMRIIAENLANADSTSASQNGQPYRRRIATITTEFDRELGATADGATFQHALTDAMKNAMSQMRTGEAAAGQGAAGQGDIVQVVNSVTAAELTLETVVAIRDRVISAYQDIMKMPI